MVARSVTLSGVEAELEQAADGVVALERLRADRFDVCFLDLNMPRMGGLEVAQAVQADEAIATHVVVVSSEAMAGRIEQLQSSGVAGYIRKPFTPTQIRDVLLRLVPHRAAA
jgi:two-component system chemotaxis response regulator CheY